MNSSNIRANLAGVAAGSLLSTRQALLAACCDTRGDRWRKKMKTYVLPQALGIIRERFAVRIPFAPPGSPSEWQRFPSV